MLTVPAPCSTPGGENTDLPVQAVLRPSSVLCNILPAGYPSSIPRRLFGQHRAATAAAPTFSHLDPAWVRRRLRFPQKRRSRPDLLSSETLSTFSFLCEACPLSHRLGPSSRSRSWRTPASTPRPARRFSALQPSGTACRAPGLPGCPWWRKQEAIFRLTYIKKKKKNTIHI